MPGEARADDFSINPICFRLDYGQGYMLARGGCGHCWYAASAVLFLQHDKGCYPERPSSCDLPFSEEVALG